MTDMWHIVARGGPRGRWHTWWRDRPPLTRYRPRGPRPTARSPQTCGSWTSAGCWAPLDAGREAYASRAHPRRRVRGPGYGPRRADRTRSPSPPRSGRLPTTDGAARACGPMTRSWPMTTSAARSQRGCGGCSTTSGIGASAVLDGGYPAWVAAGLPITTEVPSPSPSEPRSLRLGDAWTRTIDRGRRRGCARDDRAARCPSRPALPRRGRTSRSDARPHPDRDQRPDEWQPRSRWAAARAPPKLAERFRSLGADGSDGPVVSSCGSGVTACFTSLAMRVAGLPDPILYPGSYSDWTRSGLPVAVGSEPGDPVA